MNAPISSPTSTSRQTSFNSFTATTRLSPDNKISPPAPTHGKTPSTDMFLKDFTLVAEAAKRAQMAVLMRDFNDIGLS
jgi:hypothetical protein